MPITQYFIFCPKCRQKLNTKNERLIDCQHCGFHFYFAPYLTNAAILENDNNEILLAKRKDYPKKGFWDLPGGFVEMDETIEESLHREIGEELNVKITDLRYICSAFDQYLYKKINYPTLCFIFSAKMTGDHMKPSDDVSSIKFFPKNRIPYEKIAFRGLKMGIRQYLLSLNQPYRSDNTQKQRQKKDI